MKFTWRRSWLAMAMAGACLLSGPCGITGLQLRDFVSTSLVRTGVTTLFSVLEASTLAANNQ